MQCGISMPYQCGNLGGMSETAVDQMRIQYSTATAVDDRRPQATAVDPHENPQQHWVPDYCILCMKTLTNAISNIINKKTYIWPYN